MDTSCEVQIREMKKFEERQVYNVFITMGCSVKESAFLALLFRKKSLTFLVCICCLVYFALFPDGSVYSRLILSIMCSMILLVVFYKYEAFVHIKTFETRVASEMLTDSFVFWNKDGRKMLVAEYSGKVVAIVGIDHTAEPGTCEIKRMVVLPEYQGRGIGKKLLYSAEQTAISLGYRKVYLVTGQFQPQAIRFYHRMQYKPLPLKETDQGFITLTYRQHPFEKILYRDG